jgi:uncharacterized protein YuzE
MQLEFDLNVGALYIRLSDAEIARTREAGDNAAVDLDAAGGVVGIEVISICYPWPLADILASYDIPAAEEAMIRAYFRAQGVSLVQQGSPKISIASPAPTKVLVAA